MSENLEPQMNLETEPIPDWVWWDKKKIIAATQFSEATLDRMIKKKIFPKGFVPIGRDLRWRVGDVRDALERLFRGEFKGINLWADDTP